MTTTENGHAVMVVPPSARRRRAFTCGHKDCNPPKMAALVVFLRPEEPEDYVPRCPQHGPMKPQSNKPYFGRAVR